MKQNYMQEYESPEITTGGILSEGTVLTGSTQFELQDLGREEGVWE